MLYNFYCGTSLSSMLPIPFWKEKKEQFGENNFLIFGGLGCVELGYLNGEKDKFRFGDI